MKSSKEFERIFLDKFVEFQESDSETKWRIMIGSLIENNKLKHELEVKLGIVKEALEFYASAWERGEFEGELLVRRISTNDAFENVHDRAREALEKIKWKWELGDKWLFINQSD